MENKFNMCPMCGSKKIECVKNRKWICPDCGFDLYCNVASAVGVIIKDKQNNVLFEVRGKEPRKGFYAVPGGFVDFDEPAEEAAIRECKEELDITLEVGDIFTEAVHEYPDITIRLTVFNAKIAEGVPKLIEHNDLKWITPDEIPDYEFCPADAGILKKLM